MGNVKLDEDSREIYTDRMYYQKGKNKKPAIYESEEMVDSIENSEDVSGKDSRAESTEIKSLSSDKNNSKPAIKKVYEDRILYCKVCGKNFTFSKEDQKKYDKEGKCEPNRCAHCERIKSLPTWLRTKEI